MHVRLREIGKRHAGELEAHVNNISMGHPPSFGAWNPPLETRLLIPRIDTLSKVYPSSRLLTRLVSQSNVLLLALSPATP